MADTVLERSFAQFLEVWWAATPEQQEAFALAHFDDLKTVFYGVSNQFGAGRQRLGGTELTDEELREMAADEEMPATRAARR